DLRHRLAELDMLAQPESASEVAKVSKHAFMAWIFRIVLVQHRQIVEAGGADGGHQVGRLVDDAAFGGKIPQAADIPFAFQAIEGNAAVDEILSDGQPGGTGSD